MKEVFKDVVGYENLYRISNLGRLYSCRKDKIISPSIDKKGYYCFCLTKEKKQKHMLAHRLVGISFIPNHENKSDINHIDFNPLNNIVGNLEWATRQENIQHSIKGNRINRKGHRNPNAKIDENTAIIIKRLKRHSGLTYAKIGEMYNKSRYSIIGIVTKSWKHLDHLI